MKLVMSFISNVLLLWGLLFQAFLTVTMLSTQEDLPKFRTVMGYLVVNYIGAFVARYIATNILPNS